MHIVKAKSGFTLIEISIVLVIIGLIIGGILVGQDLIKAAEVRAQIAQIDKYNSAVNTFDSKYGGLPGDLNSNIVAQFGFTQGTGCAGAQGQRDGNGLIDGWSGIYNLLQTAGETGLFWVDLTTAGLIDGTFPNGGAGMVNCTSARTLLTPGAVANYMPAGKIGYGTFIAVYETGGYNWYALSAITSTNLNGTINASGTIPVVSAYNIDKKVDDGLPTTGNVLAVYLNSYPPAITSNSGAVDTATTCYSGSGASYAYSISATTNKGANLNCAISFRFQ